MSKELEALDGLAQFIIMNDNGTDESASAIEWHNTIKKALTELDELKRDVARYFDLGHIEVPSTEQFEEYLKLTEKLLKVGKKDE